MKKLILIAVAAITLVACASTVSNISGAGATFPAPLYAKWAEAYKVKTGIGLNYQPIGSGGGIKQVKAKTVDFGASDKPLTQAELDESGLYQFPAIIGGVVPAINVPGVESAKLKLSGDVLAKIFLGSVTVWNDPEIVKLNPDLTLPSTPITVVHRSDGSGTSFIFTTYLAQVSADWKAKVGAGDALEWPTGLGGKGNDGVAAFVKQTTGSIGYVEYSFAAKNGIAYALVQNAAGQYHAADAESLSAAAAGADWAGAPGNYLLLINQSGEKTWPIAGASFILVHKEQPDAAKAAAVLRFFDDAYASGDNVARDLVYVPLPDTVKSLVRKQWAENIKSKGQPVYVSTLK